MAVSPVEQRARFYHSFSFLELVPLSSQHDGCFKFSAVTVASAQIMDCQSFRLRDLDVIERVII